MTCFWRWVCLSSGCTHHCFLDSIVACWTSFYTHTRAHAQRLAPWNCPWARERKNKMQNTHTHFLCMAQQTHTNCRKYTNKQTNKHERLNMLLSGTSETCLRLSPRHHRGVEYLWLFQGICMRLMYPRSPFHSCPWARKKKEMCVCVGDGFTYKLTHICIVLVLDHMHICNILNVILLQGTKKTQQIIWPAFWRQVCSAWSAADLLSWIRSRFVDEKIDKLLLLGFPACALAHTNCVAHTHQRTSIHWTHPVLACWTCPRRAAYHLKENIRISQQHSQFLVRRSLCICCLACNPHS